MRRAKIAARNVGRRARASVVHVVAVEVDVERRVVDLGEVGRQLLARVVAGRAAICLDGRKVVLAAAGGAWYAASVPPPSSLDLLSMPGMATDA